MPGLVGLLIAVLLHSAACQVGEIPEILKWDEWKEHFGRSYATGAEELKRRAIFEMHVEDIQDHNKQGEHTWRKGVNKWSDLTPSVTDDPVSPMEKTPLTLI